MKKEDWISRYIDLIGHEPSPGEIEAAISAGAIKQFDAMRADFASLSNPALTRPSHRWLKLLWVLVYGMIAMASLSYSGYAWWRYDVSDLSGTWEQTALSYYDADSKSWKDRHREMTNHGYTYVDYITVDKDRTFNEVAFYYNTKHSLDFPTVILKSYLTDFYRVDQWHQTISVDVSRKSYEKNIEKVYKKKLAGYYKRNIATDIKGDMVLAKLVYDQTMTYSVKGDKLTIYTKSSRGKLIRKATYKRVGKARKKALQTSYKNIKTTFEKGYNISP